MGVSPFIPLIAFTDDISLLFLLFQGGRDSHLLMPGGNKGPPAAPVSGDAILRVGERIYITNWLFWSFQPGKRMVRLLSRTIGCLPASPVSDLTVIFSYLPSDIFFCVCFAATTPLVEGKALSHAFRGSTFDCSWSAELEEPHPSPNGWGALRDPFNWPWLTPGMDIWSDSAQVAYREYVHGVENDGPHFAKIPPHSPPSSYKNTLMIVEQPEFYLGPNYEKNRVKRDGLMEAIIPRIFEMVCTHFYHPLTHSTDTPSASTLQTLGMWMLLSISPTPKKTMFALLPLRVSLRIPWILI